MGITLIHLKSNAAWWTAKNDIKGVNRRGRALNINKRMNILILRSLHNEILFKNYNE